MFKLTATESKHKLKQQQQQQQTRAASSVSLAKLRTKLEEAQSRLATEQAQRCQAELVAANAQAALRALQDEAVAAAASRSDCEAIVSANSEVVASPIVAGQSPDGRGRAVRNNYSFTAVCNPFFLPAKAPRGAGAGGHARARM